MEEGPAQHSRLTFREIEVTGDPVRPLDFPPPIVHTGASDNDSRIINHRTGQPIPVQDAVLYRIPPNAGGQPEEGFWFRKQLKDAIYGSVWAALVVRRLYHEAYGFVWMTTDEYVAIKRLSWAVVHRLRGRHMEDPLKEVACLQLIGNDHPNVLGCRVVLQDKNYLYIVSPYCNRGDLFENVTHRAGDEGLYEPEARYWFRQILQGLHHLQSRGICHRDLSLENILVNDNDSLIIDMGMCLRVPYSSSAGDGSISDVYNGTARRLIVPQGSCGKLNYMSPEIFANFEAFDGFAIDLWAAGAILYIMLTGFPPWDTPQLTDMRFEVIVTGRLNEQLQAWEVDISDEAADLLQGMLQLDPRNRLTLAQVMTHPWVMDDDVRLPPGDDDSESD
uniref:Protein kinase domain-containing protein n=1 Tax=Leptocylindrus danicus TaxID=163516 RepID=A0A7S2P5Y1_9STRA|mmetsp:Transcript_23203/g.34844  ORF Transcript_23203/g.34844 Transcript_23203/m.34844 type:complete len:390 (+) Transcript_23203:123-1292(+)